jgi:uncharacterized protein (DUF1697 family)
MPRYVAFLRAVNVGGRTVKMVDLRRHFEALGLREVETFIASGNVIFTCGTAQPHTIEKRIETRLLGALGFEVKTFLRSEAEVAAIASYAPFKPSDLRKAGALVVGFHRAALEASAVRQLMALRTAIDEFHVRGREVYWLCRGKQSESTFSNAVFERTLRVSATFRNVQTVFRLAAKYAFSPSSSK